MRLVRFEISVFLIWSQSDVIGQVTDHTTDWFILQHISLSPVHSRHSQTSVWSERLKKNGANTARITHQIQVT